MITKDQVLKLILEEEDVLLKKNRIFEEISGRLKKVRDKYSLNFEIFLGGSMAKGTDIKGSDLDIFLLFSEIFDPISILKNLKNEFTEGKEEYSEHPYIILEYPEFSVDIVPAYKISSENSMITSVDRTPLHVEFVKNKFDEGMKNDSRLMKQFMKGIGVYGAESSVQGFSGYVSELLIYYYKNFDNVVENASHWKIPFAVNGSIEKFKYANFVLIDPVDNERNAGANISKENLATFILACRLFRWEKYKDFFFPSENSYELPKYGYVISIPCKKCNEEVLIPNMRRISLIIKNEMESSGFRILYSSVFLLDKGYIVLIPENVEVNECVIHSGPPVTSENVSDFLKKWGRGTRFGPPFISGDKICVIKERNSVEFSDSLKKAIEKVKLANDFSKEGFSIMKINDDRVPEKIKNNFIRPGLGSWVSGNIQ
ncbi:MAG: CCA tRNA nucleotidyltransferase [Thermoplasmata archaeon]